MRSGVTQREERREEVPRDPERGLGPERGLELERELEPDRERDDRAVERDEDARDEDERLGTLPPARRASERPIATACFLLLTLRPEPPLRRVPSFILCIARSTFLDAFRPYRAMRILRMWTVAPYTALRGAGRRCFDAGRPAVDLDARSVGWRAAGT